ncbi:MAG: MaoC family dehydratase [Flavobacteriaceae bacterium]|jgi:acyl dehydratase|nr:MaoC family dehydratase [Flavobacteriaceae bacterium]
MLKVGDRYTCQFSYTEQDVELFAKVTGDNNPIHLDKEFAKNTPFGRPIMHGFLSAAVFSKVFGTIFPGQGTIYRSQDIKFLAPMFVNETYTAEFEVVFVLPEKHSGTISCKIFNSEGKECIIGEAQLKHFEQF